MTLSIPEVKNLSESSDSEFKHLFRLALPLMGAQLAQMGMGVLDTVMAGRLSPVDLAGQCSVPGHDGHDGYPAIAMASTIRVVFNV